MVKLPVHNKLFNPADHFICRNARFHGRSGELADFLLAVYRLWNINHAHGILTGFNRAVFVQRVGIGVETGLCRAYAGFCVRDILLVDNIAGLWYSAIRRN